MADAPDRETRINQAVDQFLSAEESGTPFDVSRWLDQYADVAGGMGAVYKVRDPILNRVLALKVIHPKKALDPNLIERFRTEAQTAGQLQHPNLVPVHELGTLPDGRPYFTMKLVEGETLTKA